MLFKQTKVDSAFQTATVCETLRPVPRNLRRLRPQLPGVWPVGAHITDYALLPRLKGLVWQLVR